MKTKKSAGLAIIYDNKILLAHTTSRGWFGSYGIPKGCIDKITFIKKQLLLMEKVLFYMSGMITNTVIHIK